MKQNITAYPLAWPEMYPRAKSQSSARFRCTFAQARDSLIHELDLLGADWEILSTNVELRMDGLPYANRPEPVDPGVALYFERDGNEVCLACDSWNRVAHNIRAIAKTVEAIRGIERWGVSDFLDRTFRGFQALPDPSMVTPPKWYQVIGVAAHTPTADVVSEYRRRAKMYHPDTGGENASHERMAALNEAYAAFKAERGL